jgi:hypothetical protein
MNDEVGNADAGGGGIEVEVEVEVVGGMLGGDRGVLGTAVVRVDVAVGASVSSNNTSSSSNLSSSSRWISCSCSAGVGDINDVGDRRNSSSLQGMRNMGVATDEACERGVAKNAAKPPRCVAFCLGSVLLLLWLEAIGRRDGAADGAMAGIRES